MHNCVNNEFPCPNALVALTALLETVQYLNFWLGIFKTKVELCPLIKSAYYHKVVLTKFILVCRMAPSDLQPRYGNGVFYNIYLLALDSTKR